MAKHLIKDSMRLELAAKGDGLLVNGRARRIGSVSAAILKGLLRRHPDQLSRDSISAILGTHHRAHDGVGKAIHDLKKDLQSLGLDTVAENVRGEGYVIGNGWQVLDVVTGDPQVSEALDELRRLCEDCLQTVVRLPYVESASGVQHVTPQAGLQSHNFTRFNEAAWRLVMALSVLATANSSLILRLKTWLFDLASYVTYWRMATRHSEAEWKEEYRLEVEALLAAISVLAELIVKESGQGRDDGPFLEAAE